MKTPLLDSITKLAWVDMNGGFRYYPMDIPEDPGEVEGYDIDEEDITEAEAPDLPATLQRSNKARGESTGGRRGPRATAMTARTDNVANYRPSGIS